MKNRLAKVRESLQKIESEYADFFKETRTSITDYISKDIFNPNGVNETDLPPEIIAKIIKAFDDASK